MGLLDILPKGSKIEIEVKNPIVKPGDSVKGSVNLFVEDSIKAKGLYISLKGTEHYSLSQRMGGSRHSYGSKNIFKKSIQLVGNQEFSGNYKRNFNFRIPDDAPPSIRSGAVFAYNNCQKLEYKFANRVSHLCSHLHKKDKNRALFYLQRNMDGGIRWFLEAKLDVSLKLDPRFLHTIIVR